MTLLAFPCAVADQAHVLLGATHDSGDLPLVLARVDRFHNEGAQLGVDPGLLLGLAYKTGHDRCLLNQQNPTCHASHSSSHLRMSDLTHGPVPTKIVGDPSTYPRLSYQAGPGARHTLNHQEVGAA